MSWAERKAHLPDPEERGPPAVLGLWQARQRARATLESGALEVYGFNLLAARLPQSPALAAAEPSAHCSLASTCLFLGGWSLGEL